MKQLSIICRFGSLAIATVILLTPAINASDGSASIKLGYTFNDDTGSLAVNQETFNTYEGAALSLSNIQYRWENGVRLSADLRNITLNNRNLRTWIGKPGRFSLAATNNQYRRMYNWNGTDYTRRRNTNVQGMYQPSRYLKFFGGYGRTDKHGTTSFFLPAVSDSITRRGDWSQSRFNIGAQAGDKHGQVKVEYRRFDFTDNTALAANRGADQFDLTATTTVPKLKQVFLSGGLNYRNDKINPTSTELSTTQYWGATKIYITSSTLLDYRILFATTKRSVPSQVIDNLQNTVSIGHSWGKWGGLRLGYENRMIDDLLVRTISDGILANGWAKPTSRLYLSGSFATRKTDADTALTLLGEESRTRGSAIARYTQPEWGSLHGRWEGRFRRNNELNSSADYNVFGGELNVERPKYGRLTATYSYYQGQYENRSDTVDYEFADHVLTGHIYPATFKNVTVDAGGTWYLSKRVQDIEKFSFDFGLIYSFPKGHRVEVRYNVFNFDDFLVSDKYYTANIVEVSFTKDVKF